jgi:hypothetical protein
MFNLRQKVTLHSKTYAHDQISLVIPMVNRDNETSPMTPDKVWAPSTLEMAGSGHLKVHNFCPC